MAEGVNYTQYGSYLKARGRSDHTVESYVRDLRFIERRIGCGALAIKAADLDDLFSRKLSPARLQRIRHSWNAFVRFAETRLDCRPPKAEYQAKIFITQRPSLDPTERQRVFETCFRSEDHLLDPEKGEAVALLLHTGMRSEEARTRKVSDVIDARIQVRGKGEKPREVILSRKRPFPGVPSAVDLVQRISTSKPSDGLLLSWPNDPYRPRSASWIYAACIRIGRMANIDGMNPHRLRHAWAMDLLRRGTNVRLIQIMLGHASLDTTMRYLDIGQFDLEEARALIEA